MYKHETDLILPCISVLYFRIIWLKSKYRYSILGSFIIIKILDNLFLRHAYGDPPVASSQQITVDRNSPLARREFTDSFCLYSVIRVQ